MYKTQFTIEDTIFTNKDVYIRWQMHIQTKKNAKMMDFTGIAQLRFNSEGKIIYHQEYWDFSELMAEFNILNQIVNYAKAQI